MLTKAMSGHMVILIGLILLGVVLFIPAVHFLFYNFSYNLLAFADYQQKTKSLVLLAMEGGSLNNKLQLIPNMMSDDIEKELQYNHSSTIIDDITGMFSISHIFTMYIYIYMLSFTYILFLDLLEKK